MKLLTFHTTSAAVLMLDATKKLESKARLRPVPMKLSSSCGYALTTSLETDELIRFVDTYHIDAECLYEIVGDNEFNLIKSFD